MAARLKAGVVVTGRWVFAACALAIVALSSRAAGEVESIDATPRSVYAGEPIADAPNAVARFAHGFAAFAKVWTVAEGLGPGFNAQSCAACHHIPIVGGTETASRAFVKLASSGPIHAFGSSRSENVGPTAARKPLSLYGAGLLEAVSDSVLEQLNDPDDRNGDGISGRCSRLSGGMCGRFGWKASSDSLDAFVTAALQDELGISQPEIPPSMADRMVDFIRLLAAPRGGRITPRTNIGHEIFNRIGCGACHKEWLPVREAPTLGITRNSAIRPFTDLLLHDMGPELADEIQTTAGVERGEFRTPPLWGLVSSGPPYLHDGRAGSISDAIAMHGGEALHSRAQWLLLTSDERSALHDFLESL